MEGDRSECVDREVAPAKINLALHVTGRRADGYHLLDTLVVHGVAGDTLTARPLAEASDGGPVRLELTVAGPFAAGLVAEPDNLVLRAARLLEVEARRLGKEPSAVALGLDKHLPIASGIGGGSSDAAAALRLLNRVWGLDLPRSRLAELSRPLGADLPMCVHGTPLRARGIGETIDPLCDLPSLPMVLVNPGVAVPTPAVFRALTRRDNPGLPEMPAHFRDAADLLDLLAATRNDLEPPAIAVAPVIGEVLAALGAAPGVRLARMSGSGATCFAVCVDETVARDVAASLAARGWWTAVGLTRPLERLE